MFNDSVFTQLFGEPSPQESPTFSSYAESGYSPVDDSSVDTVEDQLFGEECIETNGEDLSHVDVSCFSEPSYLSSGIPPSFTLNNCVVNITIVSSV